MKEIKTKSTIKDIKALDKTADVSRRAKNAYISTKEQAEQTQQPEHNSFTEYAEDKVKEGTDTFTREAGHTVEYQGKKIVQKIKERHNSRSDTYHTDASDGCTPGQNSRSETGNPQTGNRSTASSKGKQTSSSKAGKVSEPYNVPVQAKQPAQQKAAQSKIRETAKRKYSLSKTNELAKRRFIQNRAKARFSRNREMQAAESKSIQIAEAKHTQTVSNSVIKSPAGKVAVRTISPNISGTSCSTVKQSIKTGDKTLKNAAKGTIKTARKSIKTAKQTAKVGVKTSQAAAKAATKTAQTIKAAQRSAQVARNAAIFTVRMVKLAVKATAALVKGLIALVGTGGAVLSLFLVIIAVAALVASPFGIFFSYENKDAEVTPISNVVQEVNAEFDTKIEDIKEAHDYVDSVEIHYSGSADNIRVDNWMDVMAVFAVKTAMDKENGMDVATIDTTRIDLIKSVFWDMNLIDYYVETIEHTETETVDNGDGTTSQETTTTYEYILHITITSKTAEQQAGEYGFTDDQMSVMEEMLSGEFRPMMYALLGMDDDTGLTAEQLQNLYNDLPVGQLGGEAVKLALSRLGDPYSQPKAGQGEYTDCSYLVQWCYQQLGISLPRTAAAQGEYCVDNGLTISKSDLVPGDLVFWSFENNDRFMNITHVGIYAGDGMVVDASSTRGQVVYRKLYDVSHQVLYGRPGIS